jgi:hypothetical protein
MYVPFHRRGYSYVRDEVIFLLLQRFMEDKKTSHDFVILIVHMSNLTKHRTVSDIRHHALVIKDMHD